MKLFKWTLQIDLSRGSSHGPVETGRTFVVFAPSLGIANTEARSLLTPEERAMHPNLRILSTEQMPPSLLDGDFPCCHEGQAEARLRRVLDSLNADGHCHTAGVSDEDEDDEADFYVYPLGPRRRPISRARFEGVAMGCAKGIAQVEVIREILEKGSSQVRYEDIPTPYWQSQRRALRVGARRPSLSWRSWNALADRLKAAGYTVKSVTPRTLADTGMVTFTWNVKA